MFDEDRIQASLKCVFPASAFSYSFLLKIFSSKIISVFKNESNSIKDSLYYNAMENNERAKFIGSVEDSFRKTSANGNQYIKVLLSDEVGNMPTMMVDSRRQRTCTEYLNKGNKVPSKDSIVVMVGRKAQDILFVDSMSVVDERIYMKLADLK